MSVNRISQNTFWQISVFRITIAVCILFFLLTVLAMFLYPGGTITNPHTQGYSFFLNFFSDLGRTSAPSGLPNLTSMVLFSTALIAAALGLAFFFVAFTQFFTGSGIAVWLSRLGALCGLVTSICFIGVACRPANLYLQLHNTFVNTAFRSFLVAVLLLLAAILLKPNFPRRFAWIFGGFSVLLAGYILLLTFGPPARTLAGEIIQVTGQKIIVYASILTILIQALNAQHLSLLKISQIVSNAGAS